MSSASPHLAFTAWQLKRANYSLVSHHVISGMGTLHGDGPELEDEAEPLTRAPATRLHFSAAPRHEPVSEAANDDDDPFDLASS